MSHTPVFLFLKYLYNFIDDNKIISESQVLNSSECGWDNWNETADSVLKWLIIEVKNWNNKVKFFGSFNIENIISDEFVDKILTKLGSYL